MDKISAMKWLAHFVLLTLASPASAGWCESFNSLRFDPDALERCIGELKFNQLITEKTRDTEIAVLRLQLCELALKLMSLKSEVNDFIKETCVPEWEAAKKRAQARSKAKSPPPKK